MRPPPPSLPSPCQAAPAAAVPLLEESIAHRHAAARADESSVLLKFHVALAEKRRVDIVVVEQAAAQGLEVKDFLKVRAGGPSFGFHGQGGLIF